MEGSKLKGAGNRDAVLLKQESFRVMIDAEKAMIPELSAKSGDAWVNAHWQPWFRANSGEQWDEAKHSGFWKVPLLYDIAGNFPCVPNFGPDNKAGGYNMPPHGFTAFETWQQENPVSLDKGISAMSTLKSDAHPFSYKKTDLLLQGHNVHYSRMDVTNTGKREEPFNFGWHNTTGSPFLESGCLIDNNARTYAIPPEGGEFDPTGELAFGEESNTLEKMPLRRGGVKDMRQVRGVTGYADFITGAVPLDSSLGWSSIVNPRLKLLYLSFFTGPAALTDDEIGLYFYDLWLNYGGRDYQPWAVQDGQSDQTFCLGAENATGYFANGLEQALEHPELMGNPTFQNLESGATKTQYYATLFQPYEGDVLDRGVKSVEGTEGGLILTGYTGKYVKMAADWEFNTLKNKG